MSISDQELDAIAREEKDWHLWLSDAGRVYATRLRVSSLGGGLPPGCYMTIDADNAPDLRRAFAQQHEREPAKDGADESGQEAALL